jgi:hypothetical protein
LLGFKGKRYSDVVRFFITINKGNSMFKRTLCFLLPLQMTFTPLLSLANPPAAPARKVAATGDFAYEKLMEIAGQPNLTFLDKDRKPTTLPELKANKANMFFLKDSKSPYMYGYKLKLDVGALKVSVGAYDPDFKLIDSTQIFINPEENPGPQWDMVSKQLKFFNGSLELKRKPSTVDSLFYIIGVLAGISMISGDYGKGNTQKLGAALLAGIAIFYFLDNKVLSDKQ